jgi:hypothetical protein
MKHRKLMTKAILIAGSCMLIALYGCNSGQEWKDEQQRQPMGQFFPSEIEQRDMERIMRVQAAAGARGDATLQPHHFDKGEVNSLGREKLSLMLDDDDTNNPISIYLNLPQDDEFKAARQDSIIAYLKDQGLEEKQVSFKAGSNPGSYHPASGGLLRMAKTETGSSGSQSPAGGTNEPMSADTGGSTSK